HLARNERNGARLQPRPNVLIEAGMALAWLGRERTVIVDFGPISGPSGLYGLRVVQVSAKTSDNFYDARFALGTGLTGAQCPVDRGKDTAGRHAGKFDRVFQAPRTSFPRLVLASAVLVLVAFVAGLLFRWERNRPPAVAGKTDVPPASKETREVLE